MIADIIVEAPDVHLL